MRVPLDQPHYGIGPAGMVRFVRKYATFRGRASRSEFWWAQLALALVSIVLLTPGIVVTVLSLGSADAAVEADPTLIAAWPLLVLQHALPGLGLIALGAFLQLGLAVPACALGWRRLQDAGLPGPLVFAFTLGGAALGLAVAAYVPGFLPSSALGARFERGAAPLLAPGVAPDEWQRESAWSTQQTSATADPGAQQDSGAYGPPAR